jgi:hypothetical protein
LSEQTESEEPITGQVVSSGWRWLIPRVPVWARGSAELHRVRLHGTGFRLPFEGAKFPARGFFTTRIVAASSTEEARAAARRAVQDEWRRSGFETASGAMPSMSVDEHRVLVNRWIWRPPRGFIFYASEED